MSFQVNIYTMAPEAEEVNKVPRAGQKATLRSLRMPVFRTFESKQAVKYNENRKVSLKFINLKILITFAKAV